MTTTVDILKGALRRIGAYQPGDPLNTYDQNDTLETFNDLLDSWSIDHELIYGTNENILTWVPGQSQYQIGNPSNAQLGLANITGTVSGNTITAASVPSQLVAGNSITAASTITDLQNVVPAGTYVTATTSSTITLSNSITSAAAGTDTFYWSVPGDFGIARPLRITFGFTRFNALDFPFDVCTTQSQYLSVLYKAQPGPWPVIAWYNPQFPYGVLNVYQTPGQAANVYLYTDTILSNLTLNQVIVAPQGYVRAFKWALAAELAPEYGVTLSAQAMKLVKESVDMIKALNAKPAAVASYDEALLSGPRGDFGFIFHGGYGR